MSATYEGMSPGGHETYATSIFSKIKAYLDDLETLEKTSSGAIATFDDGSDLPMPSLKVSIEPVQSGSGDPSPTNVRPISGWSECNLRISGGQYVTFPIFTSGKSINSDGVVKNSPTRSATIDSVPCNENTQYTIESNGNERIGIFYYKSDDSFISFDTWGYMPRTFTTPSECAFIRFSYYTATPPTYTVVYETVGASSYTIDLDGTRYGGTLDVVSGVLTVDRAYVDLGTLYWEYNDTYAFFYAGISDIKENTNNILCSDYKPIPSSQGLSEGGIRTTGTSVYVKDSNYIDAASFKQAMNGVQLVYELATPITIQLTPTQVKSLISSNNVWADTGDIEELVYFRNAKSTQAIRDIIDTTTAKDIAITTPDEMTATNVQEAIDKHTEMLTEQGEDISEIKSSLVNKQKNVLGDINAYWNDFSVTINFSGSAATVIQTGMSTDIVQLPTGVPLPNTTVYFVVSSGENTNQYVVIGILSDGWIRVYNYTGSSISNLYGNVTYLC